MRSITRPLVVLPLLLVSLACSGLRPPEAAVKGASLGGVGADGVRLDLAVDLTNRNAFDVPVEAADYKLAIGGKRVLRGEADLNGDVLPANASRSVVVPVEIRFADLLAARDGLLAMDGNLAYDFNGGVTVAGGDRLPGRTARAPVRYRGSLPIRDVLNDPKALLTNPLARRLVQQIFGRSTRL